MDELKTLKDMKEALSTAEHPFKDWKKWDFISGVLKQEAIKWILYMRKLARENTKNYELHLTKEVTEFHNKYDLWLSHHKHYVDILRVMYNITEEDLKINQGLANMPTTMGT